MRVFAMAALAFVLNTNPGAAYVYTGTFGPSCSATVPSSKGCLKFDLSKLPSKTYTLNDK